MTNQTKPDALPAVATPEPLQLGGWYNSVAFLPDRRDVVGTVAANFSSLTALAGLICGTTYDYILAQITAQAKREYEKAPDIVKERDQLREQNRLLHDAGQRVDDHCRAQMDAKEAELTRLRARLQELESQQPIAAQMRFRYPQKATPDWSPWQLAAVGSNPPWSIDSLGWETEYRLLYAAPVPAPAQTTEQSSVRQSLAELVEAMVQYEMDVDGESTQKHREMMRRAREALVIEPAPSQVADQQRIDWLQEQTADVIYMDDGRIIDVRGLDVRKAIDRAMLATSQEQAK